MGSVRFMICPPRTKPDGKSEFHDGLEGIIKSKPMKSINNQERMNLAKFVNSHTRPARIVKNGIDAKIAGIGGVGVKEEREV